MARPKTNNSKHTPLRIRVDDTLDKAIEDFMKTRGIENKSEATRELIGLGILHYYILTSE